MGSEPASGRRAVARGHIVMSAETVSRIAANTLAKGDVLGTARFEAILAAKSASSFLALTPSTTPRSTSVEFSMNGSTVEVEVTVVARDLDGDGVAMSALSAATVATLTIYDMCKSADRSMSIGPVQLVSHWTST